MRKQLNGYTYLTTEGDNMEAIIIQNDQLQVTISPLGAQMLRIVDAHGDRLWGGDPDIWGSHAPVLFPVAGALTNNQYRYDGKTYTMGRHGFARTSLFTITEHTQKAASFLLDTPQDNYPFDYAFLVHYRLDANRVVVTYEMANNGTGPMYASVGAHEAYAIQGELSDWQLVFDMHERIETREMVNGQLSGARKLYAVHGDTLPMNEDMFYCDTMVFADLHSRGVTLRSDHHPASVHVSFDGMDYLMIWKKPGAPFLCIEPWCNPPDPVGFRCDLTQKPGIIHIPAGDRVQKTHVITLR